MTNESDLAKYHRGPEMWMELRAILSHSATLAGSASSLTGDKKEFVLFSQLSTELLDLRRKLSLLETHVNQVIQWWDHRRLKGEPCE
jgi:hypothetical protein